VLSMLAQRCKLPGVLSRSLSACGPDARNQLDLTHRQRCGPSGETAWTVARGKTRLGSPRDRLMAAITMLALSCSISLAARAAATSPDRPAVPSSPAPPAPAQNASSPIQVTAEHEAYTAHAGECAVDVTVPTLHGPAAAAALERVNVRLREAALADIPADCRGSRDTAKARANALCADLPDQGKTDVVVVYRVGMIRDDVVSLLIDTTACHNPSLHPDVSRRGFTVDLRTAQVIPLERLFAPNSDWRKRLAVKVERELRQRKLNLESPREVPTNYYLSTESLVLLGVVSAHAFASLEITIPFSELHEILGKDSVARNPTSPTIHKKRTKTERIE
jgi:hypothetical protein